MPPTPGHRTVRVAIIIDVYDQPLLTTLIWARLSADTLTNKLWEHGVLAHVAGLEIDEHHSKPSPSSPSPAKRSPTSVAR